MQGLLRASRPLLAGRPLRNPPEMREVYAPYRTEEAHHEEEYVPPTFALEQYFTTPFFWRVSNLDLPEKEQVLILYRRHLKNNFSWALDTEVAMDMSWKTRAQFRANMNEKDPEKIRQLIHEGEKYLFDNYNNLPYIMPSSPGGTLWQRNPYRWLHASRAWSKNHLDHKALHHGSLLSRNEALTSYELLKYVPVNGFPRDEFDEGFVYRDSDATDAPFLDGHDDHGDTHDHENHHHDDHGHAQHGQHDEHEGHDHHDHGHGHGHGHHEHHEHETIKHPVY